MKLSDGGDLLRDHILRGISEESFNNLHLAVYGEKELRVNFDSLKAKQPDLTPCEDCLLNEECIGNLKGMPQKRLLAELAVRRYRKIAQDCGSKSIIGADFLLLIMEKIDTFITANESQNPIRQMIYQIAKLIAKNLDKTLEIRGNFNLKKAEITSTFDQEIRKYEQMGLIAYSREVRKLPSEAGPSREVFRFDRRFSISDYGRMRLDKVRRFKDQIPEFKDYIKTWTLVETEIEKNRDTILKILTGQ